ncbi:hypothetical protein ATL17_0634 [Maritalea mobilis]|uniref:Cupin 2 conserved barrel domain-containing protein n=1 Tax=Maritalea mobilis TaxID=483324 RepID=A0A4R6VT53_9HYPH|nr:hypothetical protein [Maritalea mobilis]TDQ66631.1 hypothetical protein ATL17_0634 [Maritalea mobilis]
MRVKFDDLLERLPGPATRKWPNGVWFAPAFSADTLSVQLYTPKTGTYPAPPGVNIIYMGIRGRADISIAGQRHEVQIGDIVPIEADVPHEFVSFTSDFAVYVVFWRSMAQIKEREKLKAEAQRKAQENA